MKSIIDNSVITCNEIIDWTQTLPINANDKKATHEMNYILHCFLLATNHIVQPYSVKPLHITFQKVDRYIRNHNRTKYLELFHSDENYERIFDRISHLIMLKSNISDAYSHKHMKIKYNSDDDLPSEKNKKYA